jgi:RNA polymerase sigma-70 factor (ECF subfamily)
LVGRILRRVFGSSPDSVDLSQEVFLCVFQQITRLRQPEALRSYIVGICLRVARNHLRRKKVRAIVGLTENIDLLPSPAVADPDTRDAVRRLCQLLEGLTAEDRSLFVSRYVEGMRVEEIASLHEMTFPTARRRLDRMTKRVCVRAKRDEVLSTYFERFPFTRTAGVRTERASV